MPQYQSVPTGTGYQSVPLVPRYRSVPLSLDSVLVGTSTSGREVLTADCIPNRTALELRLAKCVVLEEMPDAAQERGGDIGFADRRPTLDRFDPKRTHPQFAARPPDGAGGVFPENAFPIQTAPIPFAENT
jgi:hypothetical protein